MEASSTGRSNPLGIHGPGFGTTAVWIVESYLWLPFMILPIYAGLERIPNTLISASDDLGAHPLTTFRRVVLPLVFPAVVAGSIFTFSLTLGDYITPSLVSPDTQFIGNVVQVQHHQQPATRLGLRHRADRRHGRLPADRTEAGSVQAPMSLSRSSTPAAADRDRDHAGLHLHPADRGRDLRLQRRHHLEVAALELDYPLVRRRPAERRGKKRTADLARGRRAGDGDRALAGFAGRDRGRTATGSSAARRSRFWSSCRSPCPASSPASPSPTPSPRCWASTSGC